MEFIVSPPPDLCNVQLFKDHGYCNSVCIRQQVAYVYKYQSAALQLCVWNYTAQQKQRTVSATFTTINGGVLSVINSVHLIINVDVKHRTPSSLDTLMAH